MTDSSADQRAREEVAVKLGESFETLACAATVKAETMDSHAVIIATLSTANAELVATNARLVAQLATALGKQKVTPPPGYPPSNQAPPPCHRTRHDNIRSRSAYHIQHASVKVSPMYL